MNRTLADLLRLFIMLGLIVLALLMLPLDRPEKSLAVNSSHWPDANSHLTSSESQQPSADARKTEYVPTSLQLTTAEGPH